MDLLDDRTKLAVRYRKEYPETSLKELAEIITLETGKSLSKSGINHRFRKVRELAASFEKMNKKVDKSKYLFKNTVVFAIGNLGTKFINFLMI